MSWLVLCGLLLFAMVLSALVSGAETGFYLFSRLRLRIGLEQHDAGALRVEKLIARPALLLAVLLIANNLSLELVTLSYQILLERYSSLGPEVRATVGSVVATPLIFLFCEALPKSVFMTRPYGLLRRVSGTLLLVRSALLPVGLPLTWLLRRWERGGTEAGERGPGTERSIEPALHVGLAEGFLSRTEHLLAANVLRLGSMTARDVAVRAALLPRLELPATAEGWARSLLGTEESRALVHDEGGRVVGLVHAVDLALAVHEGMDLEGVIRPLETVDADLPLAELLQRLGASRVPLALLSDIGGEPRIARTQDVVEEVVGRIRRL